MMFLVAMISAGCGAPSSLVDEPDEQRAWNDSILELELRSESDVRYLCLRIQSSGQPWQSLRCVTARHRTLATWDDAGRAWLYSGDVGLYWYERDASGVWREGVIRRNGPADQPKLPPELDAELSFRH